MVKTSLRKALPRLFLAIPLAGALGCSSGEGPPSDSPPREGPVLVAHRGASAYAPEHSAEAYELGIEQGADFVEPDVQITADGVLIALHDLTLERTTNVREIFPDRSRTQERQGELVEVWLVSDFTLDEIKRLDAGSWFDDSFAGAEILTLSEVIELVRGRAGLFIETKAPEIYGDRGFDMEALLLAELARHGLDEPLADPNTPIVIQSFSAASLELLRYEKGTRLPMTLLIGEDEPGWLTSDGLAEVAKFATGVGPEKSLLLGAPEIVDLAHENGLTVVPWTFRARSPGEFETVDDEMLYYLSELGVDGIITDNPDRFPAAWRQGRP